MDIVDGAKTVCFLMLAGGKYNKYVDEVSQVSFSGKHTLKKGTQIFLATEFYLLQFVENGWKLRDLEESQEAEDALNRIPFNVQRSN